MLRVFDMFSGCGGFRLGFQLAGFEFVGFCEIDKWASKIYKEYFNTENEVYFKDATKIDTRKLPDFDVLCAGFPCQSFSIAGKRQGFKDTRGTLFFDVARILKDKQPKYFVLENVKGLLNHDHGRTFATIIDILADLGYSVEWQVLNSKYFGVPQNRERVFIVGYFGERGPGQIFPIEKTAGANNTKINLMGNINPSQNGQNGNVYNTDGLAPTITVNKGEGVKISTSQIKCINPRKNDTTQSCQQDRVYNKDGILPSLTSQFNRSFNVAIPVMEVSFSEKKQNGRRFKEDGDPMFTLTGQSRHGVMIKENTAKGYTVAEKGDSVNLSFTKSKTRRGRVGKGIAQTLETACHQGYFDGLSIRKLTPLECFRLQGFPDDFYYTGAFFTPRETSEIIRKHPTKYKRALKKGEVRTSAEGEQIQKIVDAQLYKMAGNSVTVNVVFEVAERIKNLEKAGW